MGFAYRFDEKTGEPVGLFKHKKAVVINTAGASEEEAKTSGMTDAMNRTEVEGMFTFCGIRKTQHVVFYNMMMTDDKTRRKYLDEARELGKKF